MEYSLPLVAAWVLHCRRQAICAEPESQHGAKSSPSQRRAQPEASASSAAGAARLRGRQQDSSEGSSSSSKPAIERPSLRPWLGARGLLKGRTWFLVPDGVPVVPVEDVQKLLLRLALLQLGLRYGLWERLVNLVAIRGMRTAHRVSKGTLKLLLLPVLGGARCATGMHSNAALCQPGPSPACHRSALVPIMLAPPLLACAGYCG